MKTAQLLTAYCVMQCDNATELAKKSGYLSRSIRGWLLGQHEPRYDAVEDMCLSVGLSIGRAVEQAHRAEKCIKQYVIEQLELNAKLGAARRRNW